MTDLLLSEANLTAELPWLERLGVQPSAVTAPIVIDRSSVVVVGNGTLAVARGSEIDSFPTVVRFNQYQTSGYEDLVGRKTSIHVLNSQNLTLSRKAKAGEICLLIDTGAPRKMFEFYFENAARLDGLQIVRPSLYQKLGRCLKGRYKTQGFFFIELARLYFESIAIAGFSGNTHYFNPRWKMYTAHPLDAEHQNYVEWESATFRILT